MGLSRPIFPTFPWCRAPTGGGGGNGDRTTECSMAWTATATLCYRLIRLPSSRRSSPSRARSFAAQSPDAVDKEYADLNLRPLYSNVCTPPLFTSFLMR